MLATGALAGPAQAAAPAASGAVGSVQLDLGGVPVTVAPLAPCELGSTPQASTGGTSVPDVVSYGSSTTTCGTDDAGNAFARAEGGRFESTVLTRFGGPTVRIRSFSLECRTNGTGSSASMALGGVSGFELPQRIEPDSKVTVPSRTPGAAPLAELTLNEFVVPEPADGTLTTHALRMTLFPQGGPASGDIVLGTANCDPSGG
ncbi:hypothetical protein CFN78_06105 [Amycolatopsis antarctica]|uniref:Uncharacterized protein n=2 Tax=Amycolatopsis antarctica TaxID=1854586 RepID=A0A263D630_9PSEU|nr:hypothetical protein CFN78_06105 [Amycolatopsis antarctica]